MTENEIFRLYEPSYYRLVFPVSHSLFISSEWHLQYYPSVFSMKNIRLSIIGCSTMLALWMTASFIAQPQLPAPATSKPIVQPVASVEPIENNHKDDKLSEPLARVK